MRTDRDSPDVSRSEAIFHRKFFDEDGDTSYEPFATFTDSKAIALFFILDNMKTANGILLEELPLTISVASETNELAWYTDPQFSLRVSGKRKALT